MKFSLLNCFMLIVAVAAIVAWQVDKSRFESTLSHYGEYPRDEEDEYSFEIDGTYVLDSFPIGDIMFVVLYSDFAMPETPVVDLQNVCHPAEAEKNGHPSDAIFALLKIPSWELKLNFEEALLVDYGDAGHYWKISWTLSHIPPGPGGFGSSGPGSYYYGYVRGDGTRIQPRLFLRDIFGSYFSDQNTIVYSVLSFDDLLPTTDQKPDEQELVAAAEAALTSAQNEFDIKTKFVFESITRRAFAGELQRGKPDTEIEVWAVDFVDKSIPRNATNKNPATRITVWVTSDLKTSRITEGSWKLDASH